MTDLPTIPIVLTSAAFALETLQAARPHADALMTTATAHAPRRVLALLDRISRRWLVNSGNPGLAEIDAIAEAVGRPGVHFLSVSYEWGCTTAVGPASRAAPDPALMRVLDWRTPGLGRYIICADVDGPSGPFQALTWPGFTGVLQANAPGRFAAALNQAPMRRSGGGLYPLDWARNRARVWRSKALMPAQVLRHAFERAETYADARRLLIETPVTTPTIFALAGITRGDHCIIERTETHASVLPGGRVAANMWQTPGWSARPRGDANAGRMRQAARAMPSLDTAPSRWIAAPILNATTRLAMMAVPATGALTAQGFEKGRAATAPLWLAGGRDRTPASAERPERSARHASPPPNTEAA
ncbi:MAG: hypothetical protein AAFR55_02875 [Pseudomonadota bacterium]